MVTVWGTATSGLNVGAFRLLSPPDNSLLTVAANDPTTTDFTWTASAGALGYEVVFDTTLMFPPSLTGLPSNNSGRDTMLTLRKSFLDSVAALFGIAVGDSHLIYWTVRAHGLTDTGMANTPFRLWLKRSTPTFVRPGAAFISAMQLYPNPASDRLTLQFNLRQAGNVAYAIRDLMGRTILQGTGTSLPAGPQQVKLPVDEFPSGVYLLEMRTGNETVMQPFLKR
jgi:hypothetical protein